MAEITTQNLTTFKSSHRPFKTELHRTFGGIICESDYNTEYRGQNSKQSSIATRIVAAWKFDYQCKQNINSRKRGKRK